MARPTLVPRRAAQYGHQRSTAVKAGPAAGGRNPWSGPLSPRVGSVGLAGIEPATSPLSGLAPVAAYALISTSTPRCRLCQSRVGPAKVAASPCLETARLARRVTPAAPPSVPRARHAGTYLRNTHGDPPGGGQHVPGAGRDRRPRDRSARRGTPTSPRTRSPPPAAPSASRAAARPRRSPRPAAAPRWRWDRLGLVDHGRRRYRSRSATPPPTPSAPSNE